MVSLSNALLVEFTSHINGGHSAIQFTREEEAEGGIAMLDTKITRDATGKLSFSVYRKPTHIDQYLQFSSNQPLHHKLGVTRTFYHRANIICTSDTSKKEEMAHLQKVLSISGYTKLAWKAATKPKTPTVANNQSNTESKGSVILPYVGHMSDNIARLMHKAGVQVHLRPFNTIRSHLVHPKDKVKKEEKAGVVYKIKCNECEATYIGETERTLRKRITEHHRHNSPVGHHMQYRKHSFTSDDVSMVHH